MNTTRGGGSSENPGSRRRVRTCDRVNARPRDAYRRYLAIGSTRTRLAFGFETSPARLGGPALPGEGGAPPSAGCRIQGSRANTRRAARGIRGGSPPRISLRGSKRLSTREDVARGAHVGRESGVLCPCRSGLRSGRDQGSESRLTCTPVMHSTRVHRPGNVIDFSNTPPSTSDSRQTFARENSHTVCSAASSGDRARARSHTASGDAVVQSPLAVPPR